VVGLAGPGGYDVLVVRLPSLALLIFGDELLTTGPPGVGRVRDAPGPSCRRGSAGSVRWYLTRR
jgi:molybdopterin molybdotransferase